MLMADCVCSSAPCLQARWGGCWALSLSTSTCKSLSSATGTSHSGGTAYIARAADAAGLSRSGGAACTHAATADFLCWLLSPTDIPYRHARCLLQITVEAAGRGGVPECPHSLHLVRHGLEQPLPPPALTGAHGLLLGLCCAMLRCVAVRAWRAASHLHPHMLACLYRLYCLRVPPAGRPAVPGGR